MAGLKVGKVVHYYDKIEVAVIKVLGTINVGDKIKFSGKNEFEQEVKSMQIEHKQIETAKKGQDVGVKVEKDVHKDDEVYKIG
jgi:putative protease